MDDGIDTLVEALHHLGFRLIREQLRALIEHAISHQLGPVQVLETFVASETSERDTRNHKSRTRAAKLGSVKPLDQFDWNHPHSIDHDLYDRLLTIDFVRPGQNVLFRGPAGVGKTTLAKHLGFEALRRGHTVRFATFAGALADLAGQESLPALERRLKRYTSPSLLILDEIGYLPCDSRAADLFFNIVTRRHESRSIVITTNLAFKKWGALFAGSACVAALVDRFAQHCHTVDIDAESWRHRYSLAKSQKSTRGRSKNRRPPKDKK
ncbi:MAG: ATP-binding protein [bacterium]|nr:ATP-binding protein [bacterium]